jgi:hypothetical protein
VTVSAARSLVILLRWWSHLISDYLNHPCDDDVTSTQAWSFTDSFNWTQGPDPLTRVQSQVLYRTSNILHAVDQSCMTRISTLTTVSSVNTEFSVEAGQLRIRSAGTNCRLHRHSPAAHEKKVGVCGRWWWWWLHARSTSEASSLTWLSLCPFWSF